MLGYCLSDVNAACSDVTLMDILLDALTNTLWRGKDIYVLHIFKIASVDYYLVAIYN